MYAHVVKQAEVQEVQVGENMFYLRPFPAFKAVRMTGELSTIAGPIFVKVDCSFSKAPPNRVFSFLKKPEKFSWITRFPRSCRRSSLSRATSWNG